MNSNRDTALLDLLTEEGNKSGQKWVCRPSTKGRGLRLHQVSTEERTKNHLLTGMPVFDNPREALEDFIDRLP